MDYPEVQLLIGGKWRRAAAGRTIPVLNPATEEVIGHVARAEIADLDAALTASQNRLRALARHIRLRAGEGAAPRRRSLARTP